jgi:hypothetical protein
MTDDNFEKFLKKSAQGYNAPPVRVPREEMWAAIQAKRAAGPRVVYGGGTTVPLHERRFGAKVWLGAAAAAMLLVATGVGIGRWTASTPAAAVASKPGSLPVQPVTVSGGQSNEATASRPEATVPEVNVPTAVASTAARDIQASAKRGVTGRQTRVEDVASNTGVRTNRKAPPYLPSGPGPAYQLTALQNLSEAEALLTSFRSRSSADQQMDAQLGTWARQLLTNTRLLLDSPVGDDPQRRPLLQDLELVLVQIVQQLSPGSTPQDRDLIEKTLQQNHVMTRLRTAIPAGAQHGS